VCRRQIAAEACASSHNRAGCSVDIGSDIRKGAAFEDPLSEVWSGAAWKKNTRGIS
jgi:hypothetical protein